MDALPSLQEASAGLLFPSESEYPFEGFRFKGRPAEMSIELLLNELRLPVDSPSEEVDLEHLFRRVTTDQDWHEEDEKLQVSRFRILLKVIKNNLSYIKVFRIGTVAIDVYILGQAPCGEWVGLNTKVIET